VYVFGWPFLEGFNATPTPAIRMLLRSTFVTSKVGDPKIPTGVVPVDPRLIRLGKVPGYTSMIELFIVTSIGVDSTDTIRISGHTSVESVSLKGICSPVGHWIRVGKMPLAS